MHSSSHLQDPYGEYSHLEPIPLQDAVKLLKEANERKANIQATVNQRSEALALAKRSLDDATRELQQAEYLMILSAKA